MNSLESILSLYVQDARVTNINAVLNGKTPDSLLLQNVVGGQIAFVLAGAHSQEPRAHIYIANDKEEAAYLQNTLSSILISRRVHFFPDSFKRPQKFEEIDTNNMVVRTEIVNKISGPGTSAHMVVTYPEAIFEKVVDPFVLEKTKIHIKEKEKFDIDTVIEVLIEYGFERADFVYEPGYFSIRGGIIDIFSFGNEWPYRIDLFDDEVDSIRFFDPTSQLSIERLQEVVIIPNIKNKFKQNQKIPFFSLFGSDAAIWMADADLMVEKLQLCFEKAETFADSLEARSTEELREIFEERAFIYPADVVSLVNAFHQLRLTKTTLLHKEAHVLDLQGKPQPNFNKNFSLLIENLHENQAEGIVNFIFTENEKQIDRFNTIFHDLEAEVKYEAVVANLYSGFIDQHLRLACYTDHQIFERFHRYKLKQGFTKDQALSLKLVKELEPGDFVVHMDHGVGRFSGLEKITINGHVQETVRLIYQNNDILYVGIHSLHKISKYVGKEGTPPALSKIGGDAWKNLKRKTKAKVKDIAKELIKLYALRKASKGFAFSPDGYLQNELEASFIYEDTPDQSSATIDVKEDMMKPYPMDRLICGDVGFGKTEVAIRAAFKAVSDGKQVAVLVPTTILALQHNQTFGERLRSFGIKVDYINRFKSAKEKKETLARLKEGKLEIIIGTHALLSKEVTFKDLGLLIIDEEQKFGVAAKEKLRALKVNVDTLTLTATPIPRTLQFSLMAARDLSVMRTPPPNRQPIHTERRIFNDDLIKDSIYYEVNRGGQVFFVHNRVKSLEEVADLVRRLCPDVKVRVAHGQMDADKLEETLVSFIHGDFDVLVSTNIIETGLDIPNANTIIINNAHQFGMSDLHQLRGRVGRSNKKAFCYLFAPPLSVLTDDARKRLKTLEEFSDLGSGFHIAMKDMDIRGAGNLLGGEQSGFITDIGYETYQKILEEAVDELKETEFKALFVEEFEKKKTFVREVDIDTDIEMLIPDKYVSQIQERLALYTELDAIENEEGIVNFRTAMKDRFGRLPKEVEELFNGLRVRWICRRLGFEKCVLKNGKLRLYFLGNAQSAYYETSLFQGLLRYLGGEGTRLGYHVKQTPAFLMVAKDQVRSLKEVLALLNQMEEAI
ncbi:MAG: transcription-repair coupling factor [Saprospiraceae bacterium]|nr:transcription-repair coupling factor [Saprospiraceae bacterium]